MLPHEYLLFLNVNNIPHSGKTFYEHLSNTEQILKICGVAEYISLAGLYHSIYDTNFFKANLDVNRSKIKEIIGEEAENLVWIFCNANRPFCWFCGNKIALQSGSFLTVDDKTLNALRMIEGANLLEQQTGITEIVMFAERIGKK